MASKRPPICRPKLGLGCLRRTVRRPKGYGPQGGASASRRQGPIAASANESADGCQRHAIIPEQGRCGVWIPSSQATLAPWDDDEEAVHVKFGMNPMHPSLLSASPARSPSQPPGYGTLAGGWEGAWAGQVFKHRMNPMHPSFWTGLSGHAPSQPSPVNAGQSHMGDLALRDTARRAVPQGEVTKRPEGFPHPEGEQSERLEGWEIPIRPYAIALACGGRLGEGWLATTPLPGRTQMCQTGTIHLSADLRG